MPWKDRWSDYWIFADKINEYCQDLVARRKSKTGWEITIQPDAALVSAFCDEGDTARGWWLGRELPASAAARLARFEELLMQRILDALDDQGIEAAVQWTSEYIRDGFVEVIKIRNEDVNVSGVYVPEDEDMYKKLSIILDQLYSDTLIEVCEWDPTTT